MRSRIICTNNFIVGNRNHFSITHHNRTKRTSRVLPHSINRSLYSYPHKFIHQKTPKLKNLN
jgi:hypothetical protein